MSGMRMVADGERRLSPGDIRHGQGRALVTRPASPAAAGATLVSRHIGSTSAGGPGGRSEQQQLPGPTSAECPAWRETIELGPAAWQSHLGCGQGQCCDEQLITSDDQSAMV